MFALLLAAALPAAPSRDPRDLELLSTVTISGPCARTCRGDRIMFGSGEIVARRAGGRLLVLTAEHVIANMRYARIYLRDDSGDDEIVSAVRRERGAAATIVARDSARDLALVSFRPSPGDAYAVAAFATDGTLTRGNVVGDPYGALWTVSAYRAAPSDDGAIVTCRTCGPGDSGGGVFDERGALAGIIVSQEVIVNGDEPVAFGKRSSNFKVVPLDEVRAFVAASPPDAPAADDAWARFASRDASTSP